MYVDEEEKRKADEDIQNDENNQEQATQEQQSMPEDLSDQIEDALTGEDSGGNPEGSEDQEGTGDSEDDDTPDDEGESSDEAGEQNRKQKKDNSKKGDDSQKSTKSSQDVADQMQRDKGNPNGSNPEKKGEQSKGQNNPQSDGSSKKGSDSQPGGNAQTNTPGNQPGAMQNGAQTTQQAAVQNTAQGSVQAGAQTAGTAGGAGAGATAGTTASAGAATTSATAAGGAAATTTGAAAGLGVVLFWVVVVIVIIIILVGFIFFLIAMPGQITQKFKQLGKDFMIAFQGLLEGQENVIPAEDIANVANYLESMGYDLKGEGFVSSAKPEMSPKVEDEIKANSHYDDTQDVWRHNDTDEVVDLNSDPIMTYIVSDNLCYLIKNFNQNLGTALEDAPENPGDWILYIAAMVVGVVAILLSPLSAIVAAVAIIAGSTLAFATASNPNWGTGLISLWHEGSDVGVRGAAYDVKETGYIELDPSTKQLKVKRGWTNNAYTFDIEGWSGRYGMPLEFLLSVHIATHMPDLAIEMATTFDTDVEVLLRSINGGEIVGGYKIGAGNSDSDFLTWRQIMDVVQSQQSGFSGLWNKIVNALNDNTSFVDGDELQAYTIQKIEWVKLFEIGMPHATEGCTCCSHIEGGAGFEEEACEGTGNLDVDSDSFDFGSHTICSNCKNNAYKVIGALQEIQDNNWNSYSPYISKVTNHWFRDVYFVINDGEDDVSGKSFVQVDEDYFYETNERWTIYETYTEEDEIIPPGFEVGDYKLYEYKDGEYKLYDKSKEEAEAHNAAIQNGESNASRLIKKAVGETAPASWSAYEIEDAEIQWTQLQTADDENISDLIKQFAGELYYKEFRPADVKQVEDGQRTQTNEKIKEMFVNKAYYQYDGSIERANQIEENRKATNREKDNTSGDERREDLISKVAIARDSLGAFSILENTHTLDADYIYRDFKELIVELDYFDKEDLSDKIDNIMQWPIPDCGSGGWPIRKYEKGDTFYGTLINSKVDLELMTNADLEAAEKLLEELEDEVEGEGDEPVVATGNVPPGSIADLVANGYEAHETMEIAKGSGGWDYCVIHKEEDCTDADCTRAHCDHEYNHACGLNATIQEAKDNYHNTCCATFVSWVLKDTGFDLSNHENMHGAHATYEWCKAEGWKPITDYSQLEAGDLLFNNGSISNIGHVQMLGNNGEWLNAGSVEAINEAPDAYEASFIVGMRPKMNDASEPFEGYEPNQDVVAPVTGKITEYGEVERKNEETGKMETVEYIKIEAIHNYLYDTESPKGEAYNEGQKYAGGCKLIDEEKQEYTTFEDTAPEEAKKLEGYDYFYEEYQGVIDGFVLYIEGFDLTLFDAEGAKALVDNGEVDTSRVTRYEPNPVYNMTDNLKEARAIWKEDAKTSAVPLVQIGEDLYIKEGTVIGKTYEDPDMSGVEIVSRTNVAGEEVNSCLGNGNYMRLILRDLEDAIVEDVETYMNIDDTRKLDVDWEFFYWIPYESGPMDATGNGPEACSRISGDQEIAVGIAQWTTTSLNGGCNNIAPLCEWLVSEDSSICSELSVFASYSTDQIISNFEDLRDAWKTVSTKDRDRFLELQMDYFYEKEFKPWVEAAGVEWLLDKEMVTQGTYASLKNWGPNLGWEDVINESMSDEEICKALLTKACPISSTCGTLEERWESQYVLAKDIIDGTFTEVEEWVRTKQPSSIYGEGKNAGVLLGSVIFDNLNNIQVDSNFLAMIRKNILNVL